MEYVPVGKRTRLQKAKNMEMMRKKNKRARIAATQEIIKKKKEENELRYVSCSDNGDDDDDDLGFVDAIRIDESEFNRRMGLIEYKSCSPVRIDGGKFGNEEGKQIVNYVARDEMSDDDSVQFLGESWNFTGVEDCFDSEEDVNVNVNDNGNDGEIKDKAGVSGDHEASSSLLLSSSEEDDDISDQDFAVENTAMSVTSSESSSSSSSSSSSEEGSSEEEEEGEKRKRKKVKDKNEEPVSHDNDDEGGFDGDGIRVVEKDKNDKKKKKKGRVLSDEHDKEKKKGRALSAECGDPESEDVSFVIALASPRRKAIKGKVTGNGTSYSKEACFVKRKSENGTADCPVTVGTSSGKLIGDGASYSKEACFVKRKSDSGTTDCPVTVATSSGKFIGDEEACFEKRKSDSGTSDCPVTVGTSSVSRPARPHDEVFEAPESVRGVEDGEGVKLGGPSNEDDDDGSKEPLSQKKQRKKKKLKAKEVENVLLNTILEKGTAEGLECNASQPVEEDKQEDDLCRKFSFPPKPPLPPKSESEQELEDLFKDLDLGLGVCDIGAEYSSLGGNEDDSAELCESGASQEKLCREGKHYLILDEEIGIKCKFCGYVKLEIKYVTSDFHENPFGSSRKARCGKFPLDEDTSGDRFQFPDSNGEFGAAQKHEVTGTVWDLIPGMKGTLYEHQQKGFEFIWRNVSGGIKFEELEKPSKYGIGGCIICHAPGTGKTRLAIVFLQSYFKQYPNSKPVIIAPSNMLLTWEEEFARWNVQIPFLNLNSSELSRKEIEVLGFAENVSHSKAIRKAKLCIWAMGKGILGISYTLFEKLAGERKGTDERIKKALLEQSGILFLDEGHTPRNEDSNIWKVFSEVQTKKRVILSGTPFQNNFDELNNTLSIIREEFRDPFLRGNYVKGGRQSRANRRGYFSSKVDEEKRIEDLRNRMKPFVHVHKGEILRKTLRGLFHSVLVLKPSELQKKYLRYLLEVKNGLLSDYLVSVVSVHPYLLTMCEPVPVFADIDMLNQCKTNLEVGAKVKFLLELIKLSKGEKVLVFSQFLHPLTFIGELLSLIFEWTEGNEYLLMEGKQRTKQRQSLIKVFNDPKSEARVLLASTKACSEGIHLVGASRVVLLDVVWNPSVERQAISRAYRLGQKKDVYVYHLITSGTQEGEKYYRQVEKDRVSEQVFTSTEVEGGQSSSSLSRVSEDRILEEMIQHERMKYMFEKIIYQPKADKLIESFAPLNL